MRYIPSKYDLARGSFINDGSALLAPDATLEWSLPPVRGRRTWESGFPWQRRLDERRERATSSGAEILKDRFARRRLSPGEDCERGRSEHRPPACKALHSRGHHACRSEKR